MALPEPSRVKKPKVKTYQIEAIFAGCTQCDGELVSETGSFMLLPYHTEKIQCQDCGTEHDFPAGIRKLRGPKHSSFS
jgi:hypothetical protein